MTALTGFFSQQLLQFESCTRRSEHTNAYVAKTNVYNLSGRWVGNRDSYNVHTPMTAAMTVGLMQPAEDFTNLFVRGCSSGNCTFPYNDGASFSTLAISHTCDNISGHVRSINAMDELRDDTNKTYTTYILDTDSQFSNVTVLPRGTTTFNISEDTLMTSRTGLDAKSMIMINSITFLLRPEAQSGTNITAVNCTIFPTVNTYRVDVKNTILTETLVDSTPMDISYAGDVFDVAGEIVNDTIVTNGLYSYALASNRTFRDGVQMDCSGSKDPGPGMVRHYKVQSERRVRGLIQRTSLQWYFPADCLWFLGLGTSKGIQQQFDTMFDGQEMLSNKIALLSGNMYLQSLWRAEERPRDTNETYVMLRGTATYETINEAFSNMTKAMTAYIRTHGEEGVAGWAKGEMWSTTTCVYVRWEWIVFFAAMIGLTGIFLLLVVMDNWDSDGERLWKSSILATLFCEVDVQQERPVGREEMTEMARSTSVSLEGKAGALRLIAR